jgi:hypothetical protein
MRYVLRGLTRLDIHEKVYVSHPPTFPPYLHQNPKRHLFVLFPLFTRCITANEVTVKEDLKEIFLIIAKNMGLE